MKTPGLGTLCSSDVQLLALSNDLNAPFWVCDLLSALEHGHFLSSSQTVHARKLMLWVDLVGWSWSLGQLLLVGLSVVECDPSLERRCPRVDSGDTQHKFHKGRQRIWVLPQLLGQRTADDR